MLTDRLRRKSWNSETVYIETGKDLYWAEAQFARARLLWSRLPNFLHIHWKSFVPADPSILPRKTGFSHTRKNQNVFQRISFPAKSGGSVPSNGEQFLSYYLKGKTDGRKTVAQNRGGAKKGKDLGTKGGENVEPE